MAVEGKESSTFTSKIYNLSSYQLQLRINMCQLMLHTSSPFAIFSAISPSGFLLDPKYDFLLNGQIDRKVGSSQ